MADNHTIEQRSRNMAHIRSRDTTPEETLRKYLFSKGFRFRKHDKRYPGKPDIVLPRYKTVVFVNGCFWHRHEGCKYSSLPKSNIEYWEPKLEKNVNRDRENYRLLEEAGWRVLVVWECELKKEKKQDTLVSVIEKIIEKTELK